MWNYAYTDDPGLGNSLSGTVKLVKKKTDIDKYNYSGTFNTILFPIEKNKFNEDGANMLPCVLDNQKQQESYLLSTIHSTSQISQCCFYKPTIIFIIF